jgi:hypothetical protein
VHNVYAMRPEVRCLSAACDGTREPDDALARCSFEACCCDLASSVMSDAAEMVPTGGELTLFEAVDRCAV